MNINKVHKRCYELSDYKFYLNKKVCDSTYKEKPDDDDKLARVLLFNLEHYARYGNEQGLILTLYVLDHYAQIEQDPNDVFKRSVINLSAVPKKARQNLYSDFKEYNKTVEALVTADEETFARLVEEGLVELDVETKEEVKDKPEKKGKGSSNKKCLVGKNEERRQVQLTEEENGLE